MPVGVRVMISKKRLIVRATFVVLLYSPLLIEALSGDLDTTFNPGGIFPGIVTTSIGVTSGVNSIVFQPDGKIVAGGAAMGAKSSDFALTRYLSNGGLDSSFGSDGIITTSIGVGGVDVLSAIALQSDGKIVGAGLANNGIHFNMTLIRYTSTGTLDDSFGSGGIVINNFVATQDNGLFALVLQPDDKILVAGITETQGVSEWVLLRYETNGNLDMTFNGTGFVTTPMAVSPAFLQMAMALQSDGKIVVVGTTGDANSTAFTLARYTANGSLDLTFGGGTGIVTSAISGSDIATSVIVQPNGKIVLGGQVFNSNSGFSNFALVGYNQDGSIDTTFNQGGALPPHIPGVVTTQIGVAGSGINDLVLQSNNRILAIGFDNCGASLLTNFALARYSNAGHPDISFGNLGIVTTDIGGDDELCSVVVQPDRSIVVGGQGGSGAQSFVVARYLDDTPIHIVGSDTAVSLENFVVLPTGTNNIILTFAFLKNGFALQDSSTIATFNSVFPVSGNVQLQGGTLTLNQDLLFESLTNIQSLGTILANGYLINFSASIQALPFSDGFFQNATMAFNNDVTINSALTFDGDCRLSGEGHSIILGDSGSINITPYSTLTMNDLTIKNIAGTNISLASESSKIILQDVIWFQSDNYTFTTGSLQFKNNVEMRGVGNFTYQSSQVSSVLADSTLTLDSGFTFSYDPGTSPDLLTFVDHTSLLVLNNNATLYVTLQGLNLINGSMFVQGNGLIASEVNGSIDNGITLGNCNAVNDFMVTLAGGVQLELLQGSLNYKNVNASSFNMLSSSNILFINANSSLNVYQTLNGPGITTFGDNATLGQSNDVQLLMGTNQQGVLNFVTLPSC